MKQNKSKQKLSFTEQTLVFQTQVLITIEHDFFYLYEPLKQFFIIIGQLQIVSYLVTPNKTNKQLDETMGNSISQYMNLIPLVTRPHTFITKVGDLGEDVSFSQYCFFFILAWIFSIIITLSMLQLYFKKTDSKYKHLTLTQRIQQLPQLILLFIYFLAWTLQMMNIILFVPALELCLDSFIKTTEIINNSIGKDQSQNYLIAFFSIITIFMLFLIKFIRYLITEETITLQMKGNEKLNLTMLDIFLFVLKSVQVFIFNFIGDYSMALYLQLLCAACNSFLTVADILICYSICDRKIINCILVTQGFNISMIIVYLITNIIKMGSGEFIANIILLNFIFLASLALRLRNEVELKSLLSTKLKVNEDPALLQFKIMQNLLYFYEYCQSPRGLLIQTIIIVRHRQICEDVDCFCKITYDTTYNQVDEPKLILYTNHIIQKEYTTILLKKMNKSQKKIKNDYDKFSFILHYIAALSLSGMTTQAFQQTNILIFKKSQSSQRHIQSRSDSVNENSEIFSMKSKSITQSDKFRENLNLKIINERQRKQLKAIQVFSIEKISFIQRQKVVILQSLIKNQINQNVTNNNLKKGNAEEISHAVNLFLDSDNSNQKLKHKLLKLMQMKLTFYNLMTSSKQVDGGIIFNESQKISQKLYSTEQNLSKLYQEFPSQKIQSVICFFQAEIFNNYLLAYNIASVTKIADEKLMKMNRNLSINLFSNKITFLILGLDQQNLLILGGSNNAHEFFLYSQDEFKSLPNVDILIPPAIKKEHNIVVNEFLQSGKSKFFRNQSLNFVMRKDHYIIPVDFFYDINFQNLGNFSFAAFFEQITYTSAYMLIDLNGFVGGVTRNLFEKMGFRNSEIKLFDVQHIMYFTHITKILPNFDELVDESIQLSHSIPNSNYIHSLKYTDIQAFFLKSDAIKNNYSNQSTNDSGKPQQTINIGSTNKVWGHQNNLQQYNFSCIINMNAVVGMRYYIIEIEELKPLRNELGNFTTGNQTMWTETQMKPIDEVQNAFSNESPIKINTEQIQIELQKDMDWSVLIEPRNCDISAEREINEPQALYLVNNDKDLYYNKDDQDCQYRMKDFLEQLKLESHDHSISGIIAKGQNEVQTTLKQTATRKVGILNKVQQKFYLNKQSQSYEDSSKNDASIQDLHKVNQLLLYDVQGVDDQVKQNVLEMLQVEKSHDQNAGKHKDNGSQASSMNGVRKSPFFKKYDILQKVVNSKNNPTPMLAMNSFLAFKLFLVFMFSIIISIYVETDLKRFLQEIDILQVTNYFLAPNVQFTLERLAIYRYDHQLAAGNISNDTHNQLVPYVLEQVLTDYDSMKDNYVLQFSNVYLQAFFTNQFITIIQGVNASNVTQKYNVTLRTALELLLENVFLFKESYIGVTNRSQLYKGPGLYYQYKDINLLIMKFEGLSQQILNSTTQNTVLIQNKWNNTWLPFLIITSILILVAWLCYKMYFRKLEQLMTMFRYVTLQSIEKDKDRYKLLLNFLNKDSNLMFKYQFNLSQKEKILYLIKEKKGQNQNHQGIQTKGIQINKNLQSLRLPIMKSVIVFSLVLSIFVVFSTIINIETQIYLKKYSQTAILFKKISDLGFFLPNLFLSRETLYNWSIFQLFLTDDDRGLITKQIDLSYKYINDFIYLLNFFNPDQYLLSEKFSEQFQAAKTQSLCNFLDTNLTASSQYYCQNSFGGVLERGLAITLNSFVLHFQNEQQINNFTVRSDSSELQIEGEFITQKVTEYLKTQLKLGLVDLTQIHIDYVKNLCIFLSFFSISGILFIYTILQSYLKHEFMILKRLILLMPSTSLFFDDQFERQVRLILVKENIV